MNTRTVSIFSLFTTALALAGCNSGSHEGALGNDGDQVTGIELALTSTGLSGTEYRLAPASFAIQRVGSSEPAQVIDASADERTALVPVSPGTYSVSLRSGWQLNRVASGNVIEPIPATLIGPSQMEVSVNTFETTPVTFQFHTGESQMAIGVQVDEDPSSGSDGYIGSTGLGLYRITFFNGTSACCFPSVAEARAAYPGLELDAF
ncbi:MAG: hypothetical protein QM767_26000 [Anaeromyxobacter sp.]